MVVRDVGHCAWPDESREQHRAGAASTRAVDAGPRRVRTRCLIAARLSVDAQGLVESDDDETVLLVRRRARDTGDPMLKKNLRRLESSGLAVRARSIVSIVAKIGHDEREIRGPVNRGQRV